MATDLMAQALLGQYAQRGQRGDPRRTLAARLMQSQPPAAPITNSGAGLAYALTQGLNGFTGARMQRDADEADGARETALFERLAGYQTQRQTGDAASLAAAMRGEAPAMTSMPTADASAAPPRAGVHPAIAGGIAARAAIPADHPDRERLIMEQNDRVVGATMPGQRMPVPAAAAARAPSQGQVSAAQIAQVAALAGQGNAQAAALLPVLRERAAQAERAEAETRRLGERRDDRDVMLGERRTDRTAEQEWRTGQAAEARAAREAEAVRQREFQAGQAQQARDAREAAVAEARASRPIPEAARGRLGEAGGTVATMTRLGGTFQDGFGGQPLVGDAVNTFGRVTGLGGDQAQWWQDYQSHKNIIRNQLFGAALTATEAREFDKASINPGMAPAQIRANLQRQQQAAQSAAIRLGRSMLSDGFRPETVAETLGLPIETLRAGALMEASDETRAGNPAPGGRGAPAAPGAPAVRSQMTGADALARARAELGAGASDDALVERARALRSGGQ